MPNVSITIYLSNGNFTRYIDRKKEINAKVRELVRKEIEE